MIENIINNTVAENDDGNVEYKRQLINLTPSRFEHLMTQMKYRLTEGQGECFYEIGVNDNGVPFGLDQKEYDESIETVKKLAKGLSCEVEIICHRKLNNKNLAELLIREVSMEKCIDIRICICGNVDAGKSTLVGVLTTGEYDNGRGLARQKIFNHRHELETGRTSSVSYQSIGFDCHGKITNYDNDTLRSVDRHTMAKRSSKMVTLYDLAGHEKYLRTTMFGISSSAPDYAAIIISANNGIQRMTKEHIGLCLALKIPFFVIITRIDICSEHVLNDTLESVKKLVKLPGIRKMPYVIKNAEDDIIISAKNLKDDRIVPIFCVSSVNGTNINYIKKFLNLLPTRKNWESLINEHTECVIDSVYQVPGVGHVVAGLITKGCICVGEYLNLGPDWNGKYKRVQVKSIQIRGVNIKRAEAGKIAAFNISKTENIRRGMVLLDKRCNPIAVRRFVAEIKVLYHSTTIQVGYQPVIHCGSVKQSATIKEIKEKITLRTGDKAIVVFEFMYRPEYLVPGTKIVMRENRTRAIGSILEI